MSYGVKQAKGKRPAVPSGYSSKVKTPSKAKSPRLPKPPK